MVFDVRGPFNVCADPVLDPETIASALGARLVPTPPRVVRAATWLTWRLHLQPTPPGWVDLVLGVPLMDVRRARAELGWNPRRTSIAALLELIDGLGEGASARTPALDGHADRPERPEEAVAGAGRR